MSTRTILLKYFLALSVSATFVVAAGVVRAQEADKKPEPPTAIAIHGTADIDGEIEDAWKNAPEFEVKKVVKSETTMPEAELATGNVKLMWDADHLFALWQVKDAKLSARASEAYAQDSVELFVDELNERAGAYQKDDVQYRVSFEGKISGAGPEYKEESIKAAAKKIEGGYLIEMSIRLSHAKREAGTTMGLELQINDDPDIGARGGISKWNHAENDSYENTSDFGTLLLKEMADQAVPENR